MTDIVYIVVKHCFSRDRPGPAEICAPKVATGLSPGATLGTLKNESALKLNGREPVR